MYRAEMLQGYAWLEKEAAPKMLIKAIDLFGVCEIVGNENNPTILGWADEIGVGSLYDADSIPWCGLFIGVVAKRAGKELPTNPLWARDWALWGEPCLPALGCVLVFSRESGGHVGLYVGEDETCYHVLGGNQSDCVCVRRLDKHRLLAARESYKVRPVNVRTVMLDGRGEVSKNEG